MFKESSTKLQICAEKAMLFFKSKSLIRNHVSKKFIMVVNNEVNANKETLNSNFLNDSSMHSKFCYLYRSKLS